MVINFMKQLGWLCLTLIGVLILWGFVWNNVECAVDSVVQAILPYW